MKTRHFLCTLSSLLVCLCCLGQANEAKLVRFDSCGGSAVSGQSLRAGEKIKAPAHPVRDGYVFVGWYTDPSASIRMWDFRNDFISGPVTLYAKWVQVDETHRLLNAYATGEELKNPYVAATLQTLGDYDEVKRTLTLPAGTTVYVAPGVYWTDLTYRKGFPFDDSGYVIPQPNVGLSVIGDAVSFIGLTGDAEDVRICGNRGEGGAKGLGAGGSWYTMAVSTEFHAENITIANYAQEDLVYPRDPSQNISKRIDSKNHAEVLRSVGRGIDRISFKNVRFVGYLNMMAGFSPTRAYYKDCFIQCTDDSIFEGQMNVYENCTFHFCDNHPSWTAASPGGLNALLGCKMVGMQMMTHPMLSFAKNAGGRSGNAATSIYAVIDCDFSGRIEYVEWENKVHPDYRYAVHNNTIGDDRRPLVISASQPQMSVEYSGEALKAFKVGDEYNVYNLLKGNDGWDPKGQYSAAWAPYANLPYRFLVGVSGNVLYSDQTGEKNTIVLTPAPVPESSVDLGKVEWKYDESLFTGEVNPLTGVLTLNARPNRTGAIVTAQVDCMLPNGITAGATVSIRPVPVNAPVIRNATLKIGKGSANISYRLDNASYKDVSMIDWYREEGPNTTDGVHIGTMRNDPEGLFVDEAYKEYKLGKYDVGYYLRAVITPKYEFGPYADESITLYSNRPVTEKDVTDQSIYTDFKNLFIENADHNTTLGRWFFDCEGQPSELWSWGIGSNGAEGLWGLENGYKLRGPAWFSFGQKGDYSDMSVAINYSPGKVEGQGFGGSGCYLDVMVKFDPVTRSGYGVRIERVPATTNGTRWTLYRFEESSMTALTEGMLSAAFMPQSSLTVSVKGNTLNVYASTKSEKTPLQVKENLPSEFMLTWTDPSGALGKDNFGGCALRISNSGTPSYAYNAMSNNCVMLHDVKIESTNR